MRNSILKTMIIVTLALLLISGKAQAQEGNFLENVLGITSARIQESGETERAMIGMQTEAIRQEAENARTQIISAYEERIQQINTNAQISLAEKDRLIAELTTQKDIAIAQLQTAANQEIARIQSDGQVRAIQAEGDAALAIVEAQQDLRRLDMPIYGILVIGAILIAIIVGLVWVSTNYMTVKYRALPYAVHAIPMDVQQLARHHNGEISTMQAKNGRSYYIILKQNEIVDWREI